jgi:hypothetical protein
MQDFLSFTPELLEVLSSPKPPAVVAGQVPVIMGKSICFLLALNLGNSFKKLIQTLQ